MSLRAEGRRLPSTSFGCMHACTSGKISCSPACSPLNMHQQMALPTWTSRPAYAGWHICTGLGAAWTPPGDCRGWQRCAGDLCSPACYSLPDAEAPCAWREQVVSCSRCFKPAYHSCHKEKVLCQALGLHCFTLQVVELSLCHTLAHAHRIVAVQDAVPQQGPTPEVHLLLVCPQQCTPNPPV